jgi:hypothetical protein
LRDVAGVGKWRKTVEDCGTWKLKLTGSCWRCHNCWRSESWWCCSREERQWICSATIRALNLPGPIWEGIYFHSLLYCSFLQTSYIKAL